MEISRRSLCASAWGSQDSLPAGTPSLPLRRLLP